MITSTAWNDEHTIENFTIKSLHIDDEQIVTDHLADSAVTEEKISNNSISEIKIKDNAITTSKIKNGSITAAKLSAINEPSDGYVLSYNAAQEKFEWVAGKGLRLIFSAILTSSTQYFEMLGLNGNADKFYIIEALVVNGSQTNASGYIRLGDPVGYFGDYTWQRLTASGTTVSAFSEGYDRILNAVAEVYPGGTSYTRFLIYASDDIYNTFEVNTGNETKSHRITGVVVPNAHNITKIMFASNTANFFGAGSRFYVFTVK